MSRPILKELCVLAAGVVLLCQIMVHYFDLRLNPFGLGSDTHEFWHLSTNLLTQHRFVYTDLRHYPLLDLTPIFRDDQLQQIIPCTARVPGYSFILAVVRSLWDSPAVAMALNLFCYSVTCLYAYALGRLFIKGTAGQWIFNIAVTFSPVYLTRWGVGADMLSGALLTGFLFHTTQIFLKQKTAPLSIMCSIFLGSLAILTRANLLIFVVGFLAILLMADLLRKSHNVSVSIVLLAIILTVGSWMLRNNFLTGRPVLSTQSGYVLFRVHLGYDLPPSSPLTPWLGQAKEEFFLRHLAQGWTFNQTEEQLDQKLQSLVWEDYAQDPRRIIRKFAQTLRTLFFFSYFDISDVLVLMNRPWEERLALINASSSQAPQLTGAMATVRHVLFETSRVYKILLAAGVFGFLIPLAWHLRRGIAYNDNVMACSCLYTATLIGVVTTAFMTGAGGDRLRLAFNVPLVLFSLLFWFSIFSVNRARIVCGKDGQT